MLIVITKGQYCNDNYNHMITIANRVLEGKKVDQGKCIILIAIDRFGKLGLT